MIAAHIQAGAIGEKKDGDRRMAAGGWVRMVTGRQVYLSPFPLVTNDFKGYLSPFPFLVDQQVSPDSE